MQSMQQREKVVYLWVRKPKKNITASFCIILNFEQLKNMTLEELKIRQLTNQYLLAPADKLTVVRDLCGVQAQFMTNALHSLKIRCNDFDERTVAEGLVKNWSVRGTVHVFAEGDLPLFIRCNNGADYRKNEWRGYSFWNQRSC